MPPTPDPGVTREEECHAEHMAAAKRQLARCNLTGLDVADHLAEELADNLWVQVGMAVPAPEALVNACYRALENAQ